MKRPAFQFYPADWRKDSALQSCSIAARGLWIDLLCIMHECQPYGSLSTNGQQLKVQQIARLVGETDNSLLPLLKELEDAGVFSRDTDGTIFSRRMRRDEHIRTIRAEAGKLGGNPILLNQKDNHDSDHKVRPMVPQADKQKPTPSSSSSSSSSKKEEYTSDILRLSDLLAQKILQNNPKHTRLSNGKYHETVRRWAAYIDKLHRIDGQTLEDVQTVIEWCQADSFWRTIILSGANLRDKWDRLLPAANEKKAKGQESWR